MAQGAWTKVVVGADRSWDSMFTNKVGTLPIALAAKFYGVPFYVRRVSTLDLVTDVSEWLLRSVTSEKSCFIGGKRFAPRNVEA